MIKAASLLALLVVCGIPRASGFSSPGDSCTKGSSVTVAGVTYKTKYAVLKPGAGSAISANNTNISATVVGALASTGVAFWNSSSPAVAPGTPHPSWFDYQFVMPPKAGHLIIGFDVGSAGMKEGEVRELCIPPEEGYGNKISRPGIPRGSTLIFTLACEKVGAALARGPSSALPVA